MSAGRWTAAVLAGAWLMGAGVAAAQGMVGGAGGPGSSPTRNTDDILPEVDKKIADDVDAVFERAEKAFAKRDWLEAIAYFQHVRSKFSYNVPLSAHASLRLGDIAFERQRFPEARAHYKHFLRFHPRHEKADYATFRVGMCAWREVPGDNFFLPPSSEKDQTEVRLALQQMRHFVETYPKSEFVTEASQIVTKCEDKLAAHEMYAARYYEKRSKWRGVQFRSATLVERYPNSTLVPQALVLDVRASAALGETARAEERLRHLESLSPSADLLAEARAALESPPAKK